MLIVCPQCAMSYELGPQALGTTGRSVRCARCRTVWFAENAATALAEPVGAPVAADAEADGQAAPFAAEPETGDADPAAAEQWPAEQWPAETAEIADSIPDPAPHPDLSEDSGSPAAAGADAGGAQPAMVAASPSIVPPDAQTTHLVDESLFPITGGSVENFAARRARARARKARRLPKIAALRWPLAPLPTALLILVTATTLILGWRTDIVRLAPQTALLYEKLGLEVNLRGLVFENLKISRETHEGIPVLAVEGEIASVARKPVEIPRLRFAVLNSRGLEIYNWTAMPPRALANAGERVAFRSRLASPPAEAQDIVVRFYNRRDATAALK